MKNSMISGVVAVLLGCLATAGGAQGRGGMGSFSSGVHGGGLHGHFGGGQGGFFHPGVPGGFGHPGVPGVSSFSPFPHGLLFGPPAHFGPFVPFGREPHFFAERFFRPHRHFDGVFFRSPFFAVHPLGGVLSSPFFCFPHRLAFPTQALFIEHLHGAHGLPFASALSFCTPVGSRLFFFESAQTDAL